jgi:sarcosine oxidase
VTTLDAEVLVVGAGIAGLATAYELARTGTQVAVVEQFALGHDRGSSHGASRVFRLSYPAVSWVKMAQAAQAGWRRYESELGAPLLRRTGSVDVGSYAQANRRALEECGARTETLEPEDVRERWGLELPRGPILHQPDAGVVSAERTLELLARGARASGATIVTAQRVDAVDSADGAVQAHTAVGTITARALVVTAGAWARTLLSPLGIQLSVVATRETVSYLEVERANELPVLVFAALPGAPDGLQGRDIATYALADDTMTLKVGVHHSGPVADPDEVGEPDPATVDWATAFVRERLPVRAGSVVRAETCLYTNTADEGFVLERHGSIVVGSACSGHGFKFAPVIGSTLARLAREAVAA